MAESLRDVITTPLTFEYFVRRLSEGWEPAAIEWVRGDATPRPETQADTIQPPYGTRIAKDGQHLETDGDEVEVLLTVLEQLVQDRKFTSIAAALNERHLQTRAGHPWTQSDVFELLPELVDQGPALLKSQRWIERRAAIAGNRVARSGQP